MASDKKVAPKNVLKKVEGLIARTNSASVEEARTSAFLACKLIREHGLQVVAPGRQGTDNHPPSQASAKGGTVKTGTWWQDVLDDVWDAAGESVRVDPFASKDVRDSDIHVSTARWAGTCKGCSRPINIGDQVAYIRTGAAKGIYHVKKCSAAASRGL